MWTLTSFPLRLRLQTRMLRLGKPSYFPVLLCMWTFPQRLPWPKPLLWLSQPLGSYCDFKTHLSKTHLGSLTKPGIFLTGPGGQRGCPKAISEGKKHWEGGKEIAAEGYALIQVHGQNGRGLYDQDLLVNFIWVEFSFWRGKQSHSCVSMEVTEGFLKRYFMTGAAWVFLW